MKIFLDLIVSAGLVLITACGSANIMPVDSTSDEVLHLFPHLRLWTLPRSPP